MTRTATNDLDYLATRLHARRSRMAEAERLDELCRIRSLPELGRVVLPGFEFSTAAEFQRRMVQDLAGEISDCLNHLDAGAQELVAWLLVRFQLEDIKVLLRGYVNHLPLEALQPHLVYMSSGMTLDVATLLTAKSLEEFVNRLPAGRPRDRLQALVGGQREPPPVFVLEAALDSGYFRELITRNHRLSGSEGEIIKPLVFQEANIFQWMLVARGRFHFGLSAETLLPLRLGGNGTNGGWFNLLLSAPDILTMAKQGVGTVIDDMPATRTSEGELKEVDISAVETLAWQRYLRLANSALRRSHMGAGAVVGYFGVRRLEIANLISLSECIRLGVEEDKARARMIPRAGREEAYV